VTLVRFVFGILGRSPPNPAPSSANVSPQALFLVPLTNLLFPDPSADLNISAITLRYRLVCVTQTCATLTDHLKRKYLMFCLLGEYLPPLQ